MLDIAIKHSIIQTNPNYSRFDVKALGIAYLTAVGDCLVVNNTGHNIEISKLEESFLRPIAIYNQTIYPDDIDKVAFDLDIHATFYDEEKKLWFMLNHFGRLRCFELDLDRSKDSLVQLSEKSEILWLGDVEQSFLIDNCLVSTSPCGYYTNETAKPGLYVSRPLSSIKPSMRSASNIHDIEKLEYRTYFTDLGTVTALAVNSDSSYLAMAFGQNILIVKKLKDKNGFLSFDEIVGQVKINYHAKYLSFWGEDLFCAGHDIACEENADDISNLKGGGFAVVDLKSNNVLLSRDFNWDLAWGNGGRCVAIYSKSFSSFYNNDQTIKDMLILGIDGQANLIAWNYEKENPKVLFHSEGKYNNLGIAHLTSIKEGILCGFNRDGARLHMYTLR